MVATHLRNETNRFARKRVCADYPGTARTVLRLYDLECSNCIASVCRRRNHVADQSWFGEHWTTRTCDIFHDELERGPRSARSIPGSTTGARKTLPHVLATRLQFHQARRYRTRGGGRSNSGLFCPAVTAPEF